MAEGGDVERINQVLVKQLASIHADGDSLSRRLHDLRAAASAASATVHASASLCREEMLMNKDKDRQQQQQSSPMSNGSSPSSSSNKAVVRASRRQERDLLRDSLFNEDVTKLCTLTKLLTEENQRLDALNCRYEAEMEQLTSSMVEIQQRLDEFNRLKNTDQQDREIRQEDLNGSSVKEKQKWLVELVQHQAWGMLKISSSSDEEQRKRVKSELERLAAGFVQGLIRVEDELLDHRQEIVIQDMQVQQQEQQQGEESGDSNSNNKSQVMSYVLPAAAFSGAMAAIVISLRVSSTAASDQQFIRLD